MLEFLDILSARFFFAVANPSSIILISEVVLGTLIITLFLFCISSAFCNKFFSFISIDVKILVGIFLLLL